MDVLHLMVDSHTSHCVWRTFEKAFASSSNSRIMQLNGSFQALRQGNSSVSIYMQQAKSLFDELVAVGRPMSLHDFNLYVFRGLRGEFKDLVTSLITKADLVMSLITKAEMLSYVDLHSHLLTHEFLHKNSLQSIDAITSLLLQSPLLPTPQPSTHLVMSHHNSNFNHYTHQKRGQSTADQQPNNWQQTRRNSGAGRWSG